MIIAKLVGAALTIGAAIGPGTDPSGSPANLSMQQKNAAVQPLVRTATDCITRTAAADPRFRKQDLGDIIVDSISSCVEPVRAMIDAYDQYFGDGTGEAFFMGPYLDVLPNVVIKSAAPADGH
jgi:hypothetical protein